MHMVFWAGYKLGDFLFGGWAVNNVVAFVFVTLFSFALAVAVEGMKIFLAKMEGEYISKLLQNGLQSRSVCERDILMATSISSRIYQGIPLALTYCLHIVSAYLLMLIVMLFNTYLFIAIVLGSMIGYFFCSVILTKVRLYYQYLHSQNISNLRKQLDQTVGTTPPLQCSEGLTSSQTNLVFCHCETTAGPSTTATVHVRQTEATEPPTGKNSGRGAKKSCCRDSDEEVTEEVKESTPLMEKKNVVKGGETGDCCKTEEVVKESNEEEQATSFCSEKTA